MAEYETTRGRCFSVNEAMLAVDHALIHCRDKEYFYFGQVSEMLKRSPLEYQRSYFERRLENKVWSNAIRVREHEAEPDFMRGSEEHMRGGGDI